MAAPPGSLPSDDARPTFRSALGFTLAALAIAVAWPNAAGPLGSLPPGDHSQLQRFFLVQCTAFASLLAFHHQLRPALVETAAVCLPAWTHMSDFPSAWAPLAFVALAWALLRAQSTRHILWVASLSAATQILGAAGWIFHYFEQPLLPCLVAVLVSIGLWAPASLAATRGLQHSLAWLPLVAMAWPATEWIRGVWMSPPLPGLFLSHASTETLFVRLAPLAGDLGVSYGVALFAFAVAAGLSQGGRARRAAAALAIAVTIASGLAPTPGTSESETIRVCAIEDPHRIDRNQPPFAGGGVSAIKGLSRRARGLGCDVAVLPEYSLELHPDALLTNKAAHPADASLALLGGVYATSAGSEGAAKQVRNVVCTLREAGASFTCNSPLDKLVFAPFGEAALFYDTPWLAPLGRWLTEQATGKRFESLTTVRDQGVLRVGDLRIGASICWEILVPRIFQRRGLEPGSADVLVVPSDLNGFGESQEGVEQFRRAGRLHALHLRTPLVFASTYGAFAIGADGRELPRVESETFFAAWDVPRKREN